MVKNCTEQRKYGKRIIHKFEKKVTRNLQMR